MQTGRCMDFTDLRDYVRGDDVKDLDWKASARSGELLVKRYAAVRKHTSLLVVDSGRAMAALAEPTGEEEVAKRDVAVIVAGIVGWLAVRHGDRVGLAHGDASGCHGVPPGAGELHLERCLAAAHDATEAVGGRSDLAGLLDHVARSVRRRTIVLVVCDAPSLLAGAEEVERLLRRLAVQHELLLVTVGDRDPTRPTSPDARGRRRRLRDVDDGRTVPDWVAGDPRLAAEVGTLVADEASAARRLLDRVGVVHEHVAGEDEAVGAVLRLLERQRRARRR